MSEVVSDTSSVRLTCEGVDCPIADQCRVRSDDPLTMRAAQVCVQNLVSFYTSSMEAVAGVPVQNVLVNPELAVQDAQRRLTLRHAVDALGRAAGRIAR